MDEPTASNGRSSNTMATSTPIKRNNPYLDDESNDVKKRKMEQSVNQSVIQTKQYFPIASLKPMFSCPEIKGTLTKVSGWLTARNQAKFLVFRLRDESGEIRGLAFDPLGPDFYPNFKLGATVILKNSKVEVEEQGNKTGGPESYKLIVNRFSSIKIESISPAPPKRVTKSIRDILDSSNERDTVDVLGILADVGELERSSMREIQVIDRSEAKITITLWDDAAKNFEAPLGSVIAAYGFAVRIFNSTKCLRTCLFSQMLFDPPTDETQRLKQWYSEWTATDKDRENKNSTLIENRVHGTNNSIIDNRKAKIKDSLVSASTSINQDKFIPIEAALESPAGDVVNVLGILTNIGDLERSSMREIRIVDQSEIHVTITLWDDAAKNFEAPLGSVIAAIRFAVRIFNSAKCLRTCRLSQLLFDPPIAKTQRLKQWYSEWTAMAEASKNKNSTLKKNTVTSIHQEKYISIEEVLKSTPGDAVNIVGNVIDEGLPVQQMTKSGQVKWMKEITLTDGSNCEIELTIFGDEVKNHEFPFFSAISANNVRVRDFGGTKTLSCLWANLKIELNVSQAAGNSSHFGDFTPIKDVKNMVNAGSKYNVMALVCDCGPPEKQQTEAGTDSWMRRVLLLDESDSEIEMSICGDSVQDNDIPLHSVIIARNVTVRDFNDGKTLNCSWGNLQFEPIVPQAVRLRTLILKFITDNENEDTCVAESSRFFNNSLHYQNFTSIKEIKVKATAGSRHNIIALVIKCGPPVERQTKAGKKTYMRVIMLMDDKDSEIEIAVWGDLLKDNDIPLNSVIMARDVTARDFNDGKTFNCLWSKLQIEPNVPQVEKLKNLILESSTTNEDGNSVTAGSSQTSGDCLHHTDITSIKEVKETSTDGSKYNIVALVTKTGPPQEQQTKSGNMSWMRVLMLMDDEDSKIEMTVFGNDVKINDIPIYSVIMANNVTVRDYNDDRTLTCFWMNLRIEPNVPQAARLKNLIPKNLDVIQTEHAVIAGSSKFGDNFLHRKKITSIKEIKEMATTGSECNIIAIVTKCGSFEEAKTKAGKQSWMRVVMLMDDEDSEIEMVVWGNEVKTNEIPLYSVIMADNVMVRDLDDNKALSCLWVNLQIEPNVPQALRLKKLIPKNYTTDPMENVINAGASKSSDNSLRCGKITPIIEIKEMATAGSKCNVIALVTQCGPSEKRKTKNGRTSWVKVLKLIDDGNSEIDMAIWGNEVEIIDFPYHSVILAKDVIVEDFNDDKILNCLCSHLDINPDVPQAERLRQIFYTSKISDEMEESHENFDTQQIVFTPVRKIKSKETAQFTCDIIGVVIELQSPEMQTAEDGKHLYRRVIFVSDEPKSKIALTIWGEEVMEHEIPLHCVVTAQNVAIQQSNDDKILDCFWMDLQINPDIPEADEIAEIFASYRYAAKKHEDSNDFDSFAQILENTGRMAKWNLIGLVIKNTTPSEKLESSPEEDHWFTKVKLKDADCNQIELVVWSNESLKSAIPLDSILAAKGVEARTVGDRVVLGAFWNLITIDPDIPEAKRLEQVRKKEWNSRWPNFRERSDFEIGEYTAIDMIKMRNRRRFCLHTIGLVVKVNPPEERKYGSGSTYYARKCILRGRDGVEIKLTISSYLSSPFEISLNSVIVAKDATLNHTEDKKQIALSCRLENVEFDIDIPEAEGFKKAALNPFVRFESPETQDPNNFTAIKEIKESRPLGSVLNVLGLIVDVIERPKKQLRKGAYTRRLTLMDMTQKLIILIIKKTRVINDHIKVNSVIAARDATLRQFGDDKVLWCMRRNVEVNPRIPLARKIKFYKLKRELRKLTPVTNYMPFKTILHGRLLVGSKVDIIGQVITLPMPSRIPGSSTIIHSTILRNEMDIKMSIWPTNELNPSSNIAAGITLNTIIAAKGASVKTWEGQVLLSVNWRNVRIIPKISETDRGAESLCIVPIKWILENAKVGDKLGILAVVKNPPRKMFRVVNIMDLLEDSDDENRTINNSEIGMESAELIDASGETINMKMLFSVADAVNKSREQTVAIRAWNVQVCKYKGNLELLCTSTTRVDIKPTTKEAEELLKWYTLFRKNEKDEKEKEERRELPITPINLVLENSAVETRANILGILISSQMYKIKESGLEFETRRIQIIDDSEEVINLLLWSFAAQDFNVSLYSILLVKNVHVYTKGEAKWGGFGPGTEYKVITATGKYLDAAQRLESWFAHYCAQSQNLTDGSDESTKEEEIPVSLLNSIKVANNSIILSNEIEMVENPTFLLNDTEMVKSPTAFSHDNKMIKSPTVFTNDKKMVESPTHLSSDIESPTVLADDIKMVKSPTTLSDDINMVKHSQNIRENSRIFFGNDRFLSQKDEQVVESSKGNDVIESSSDSSNIFADC